MAKRSYTNLTAEQNAERAWEKEVEELAEEMAERILSENPDDNKLLSREAQKARLKEELKKTLLMKEVKQNLEKAVDLINQEKGITADIEGWRSATAELGQASALLSKRGEEDETFQEQGKISQKTLDFIEEIGKRKYREKDFLSAQIIYEFLTVLNNQQFDYWERLGICLHDLKEFEKAIHAYENALILYPQSIDTHLFLAECCLNTNDSVKAEEFFESAKQLIEAESDPSPWSDYVNALAGAIH